MSEFVSIPGWASLVEWFGCSPNFHDAEVLFLDLRRAPYSSTIRIHAWRTTSEVDEAGYFILDRHALVTFTIDGIQSLRLEDWNHQNVLAALWIERTGDEHALHLAGTYGMDGEIAATAISVAIEPFDQTANGC
ncbi:Imm50 family immunity protein [Sphingomonas sanxanigenens]|uniref:Uncharacterized protein n=1 Tax=Sphingomonas sanxanigenens DSM 19645 = NX02 TaxID=1123269 RepID=W0AES4_9SPHN|nr:Imm50 family immunity protein [Sphingomonas sanxanigenens]AHE55012.1 hypothetical protein NX02_16670 [Sphingomonas sanxanigenens DSM 19645 = NX02]